MNFLFLINYVEPVMGIEPMASSLPRKRSTPELHWLTLLRAEDEIRTRDPQLGRLMLYRLSYFRNKKTWGEQDSNLRRHEPADLQSAPVGHFGISPRFNLFKKLRADGGIRTPDQLITNQLLWPAELHRHCFYTHSPFCFRDCKDIGF